MPYKIRKVDGYKVTSPHRTHAKGTSKRKAQAQVRLLRGVEHGMTVRRKPSSKR